MSSSGIGKPSSDGLTSRKKENETIQNDFQQDSKPEGKSLEFAHSFPIHTKNASSILSKDSTDTVSFRGFGNLGRTSLRLSNSLTIVLVMVFGNLRLIVENYVKVFGFDTQTNQSTVSFCKSPSPASQLSISG